MRTTLAGFVAFGCLAPLAAQPKPAITPLPQSPTLTGPPTLGVMRGVATKIVLTGTNLYDVVAVHTTAPGMYVDITPNQTDPTKLVVLFSSSGPGIHGPIGLYQIRVATKHGVSNFRPLCVDDMDQMQKSGDISKKEKAQLIPPSCVVTGTVAAEAADYYKVAVKPGQTLTLEVLARRIGSPMDPVIILHDAKTLRELPALYADDTPGLQGDCRLALPNKEAAEYIVEVRDMTYQGGPTFGYRLRFGEFQAAATAFPLAVDVRWRSPKVRFTGSGDSNSGALPDGHTRIVQYLSPSPPSGQVRPRGWPVPVLSVTFPTSVEQEPNDTPETANPLPVPGGVSATFGKKGDKDHFRFDAKKGKKYVVDATTGELGAATEVYIRILDKTGKELVASDPQKVKAQVEVTATDDGPLVIACEHLLYLSGPTEVYFLTVKEAKPNFEITLGSDRIDVPLGGTAPLAITGINRLNGFNDPIRLLVLQDGDEPMAMTTIPAGVVPTPEKPFVVPVALATEIRPGPVAFKVLGTFGENGPREFRRGTAVDVVKAGLANLTYTPLEMHSQFVAGVYEPKVLLTLPPGPITLKPGEKAMVKVERSSKPTAPPAANLAVAGGAAGVPTAGDVTYTGVALPAGVTLTAKGDEITLTADAKAPAGTGRLVVRGQLVKPKGREKDPDYAVYGVGGEITVLGAVIKDPPMKK
jgi:hypothetical protein